MAFNANTSGKQLIEYTANDTYNALISALEKDSHFSVKDSNQIARTISIKTGVSWKSWGENLLITISPTTNNMAEISITSASKYGLVDWGKNQDNLNSILNILFHELINYDKVTLNNTNSSEDICTQIHR